MTPHRIYLDHNASTPMLPKVKQAITEALVYQGNASSIHQEGRKIRQLIEESREKVASYLKVHSSRIVFTSGATEANNHVLKGFSGPVIINDAEHDSVRHVRSDAQLCSVTSQGLLDLTHLEDLLKQSKEPVLISAMWANNESGVIQPLEEILSLTRRFGAFLHSDCVQGIGKIQLNWSQNAPNFISLSGHKIGSPQGVGVLVIDEKYPLLPLTRGGGQERSHRSGTENTLHIIGLGHAIDHVQEQNWSSIKKLRDGLEETLLSQYPEITIYGKEVERTPNTSLIRMPNVKNSIQVMSFDIKGIALSSGSACSSGKVKSSHVLKAMGVTDENASETIRVSLGLETTEKDIHTFMDVWKAIYQQNKA